MTVFQLSKCDKGMCNEKARGELCECAYISSKAHTTTNVSLRTRDSSIKGREICVALALH